MHKIWLGNKFCEEKGNFIIEIWKRIKNLCEILRKKSDSKYEDEIIIRAY